MVFTPKDAKIIDLIQEGWGLLDLPESPKRLPLPRTALDHDNNLILCASKMDAKPYQANISQSQVRLTSVTDSKATQTAFCAHEWIAPIGCDAFSVPFNKTR